MGFSGKNAVEVIKMRIWGFLHRYKRKMQERKRSMN